MNRALRIAFLLLPLLGCGPDTEATLGPNALDAEQTSQALVVDDIYSKLKQAEALMPQPPPTATVNMGTFDPINGSFSGVTSTWQINPVTRKPMKVPGHTHVAGLRALLRFDRVGGSGRFTVRVNGVTTAAPLGQSSVTVDVGFASSVSWTVTSDGNSYTDNVTLSRPSYVGAGAFTVAALPVAVVYEPPQNAARTNKASVTFGTQMSVVETLSNRTARDVSTRQGWLGLGTWGNIIKGVANTSTTAKSLLTSVSTLVGSAESSRLSGTTANTDSTLGLSTATAQTITTNAGKGPGVGDVFVFYRNARVGWVLSGGKVSLALLDKGQLVLVTAETLVADLVGLQNGTKTVATTVSRLDAATLDALLDIDPMVGAGFLGPTLSAARFDDDADLFLGPSTAFNATLTHVATSSNTTAYTSYTGTFTDSHAGWLSVLGLGQSFDGTVRSTVTMGSSRTVTQSSSVSAAYNLSTSAAESLDLEVKYDSVFRTFLLKKPSLVIGPISNTVR